MKIWSQCGAVCIAPEDDEERQACEIAELLESLLSEGWSVVRTDVLPGLNGKGEYKVPPNTCFEPSLPPTLVYILGKEAE